MKIYDTVKIVSKSFKHGEGGDIGDFTFISADITIGNNVHIASNVKIIGKGKVTLKDGATIGPGVVIYTSNPDFKNSLATNKFCKGFKNTQADVEIGKNAFIGANSVVAQGVKIGDNALIGALSLVIRSIPNNSVAVGSPARVIKKRNIK